MADEEVGSEPYPTIPQTIYTPVAPRHTEWAHEQEKYNYEKRCAEADEAKLEVQSLRNQCNALQIKLDEALALNEAR